ncbi:MAG: 30S ribosomal protein S15 [Nanoarchaeota archaeon]|mgnify:CR=1 FL=1
MARMYSGKKGKAGSKKPVNKHKLAWIRYSNKEVEQLITKLAKQGKSKSEIGMILRDTYGIPSVKDLLNKRLHKILEENKLAQKLPEDMVALIKNEINIIKHFDKNKRDMHAKRGLLLTESKIHRLAKYYKNKGVLPKDWNYDRKQAAILVS